MPAHRLFSSPHGRVLAYHTSSRAEGSEKKHGLVFLGGFRSDMEGTKALFLEQFARETGRDFLRFDYSGHGQSEGEFLDGCITEWTEDAVDVIAAMTDGPQILVGSSMGGWIALRIGRDYPEKVYGIIGIAAAPDFTEDSMWAEFSPDQRRELAEKGQVALPSDYSDDPYVITRKLIEDGRNALVLRDPLPLPFPVRLLHGTADTDVKMSVPQKILDHANCDDLHLTFVKGADHRFSTEDNLELIAATVEALDRRNQT